MINFSTEAYDRYVLKADAERYEMVFNSNDACLGGSGECDEGVFRDSVIDLPPQSFIVLRPVNNKV